MKVTTIFCDLCGAKDAVSMVFWVDHHTGAAGSMEDKYESIDVCITHAIEAFQIAESLPPSVARHHMGNSVFETMKKRMKKT